MSISELRKVTPKYKQKFWNEGKDEYHIPEEEIKKLYEKLRNEHEKDDGRELHLVVAWNGSKIIVVEFSLLPHVWITINGK